MILVLVTIVATVTTLSPLFTSALITIQASVAILTSVSVSVLTSVTIPALIASTLDATPFLFSFLVHISLL